MAFWSRQKKEKDVVCGMEVDPKTASASMQHEGRTYYFCSSSCKANFGKEPQKYTKGPQEPAGGMGASCH